MSNTLSNKYGELISHTFHETEKTDHLVILAHGLTGNKDRPLMVQIAEQLASAGWQCLRISFSGNGESEGNFAESCISKQVEDLSSIIDQVGNAKKIIYIGHSMGAAVGAMAAAKDDRISALISLAGMVETKTFCDTEFGDSTPGESMMWDEDGFPLSQTFVDDLTSIESTLPQAKLVNKPWLLIHGDLDDVVLPRDSASLFDVIKKPKAHVVIEGADHSFSEHQELVIKHILEWLKQTKI